MKSTNRLKSLWLAILAGARDGTALRCRSAQMLTLLGASTILLTNCAGSGSVGVVGGGGGGFVGSNVIYANGFYGNYGPDAYVFGDGFYNGRNARYYSHRGYASRSYDSNHGGGGHIGGDGGHGGGFHGGGEGGGHSGGGGRR